MFCFSVIAGPSRKAHPGGCGEKPVPATDVPDTNFVSDAVGEYFISVKQYVHNIS